ARCRGSARAGRSWRSVSGHSCERCGIVTRLATVRWQRPSAVSGAGETVAALAVHIDEADHAPAISTGSVCESAAIVSSHAALGRGRGTKNPCARPSATLPRIFASPCRAAARGYDTSPACAVAARLPKLSPAWLWLGPTRPSKLISVSMRPSSREGSPRHAPHRVARLRAQQLARLLVH